MHQNKLKVQVLLAILIFLGVANAQTPSWCWGEGSVGSDHDEGRNVATDASGNVYVTGTIASQIISFGSITLSTPFGGQVFLVKYDQSGSVLWAKSSTGFGGGCYGVATDASGNVYLTGTFNSTITFGTYTLTNGGVFLAKYDKNGNVLWAKSAGGINDGGFDVTTDASGNIYVTGSFYNPSITFGTYTLTNAGGSTHYDVFLAKYNSSGNVLWAAGGGGSSNGGGDHGYGVVTDAAGIFITGFIGSATASFGSYTVNGPGFFLIKYDAAGNVLWVKYNANNEQGKSDAIDTSGNIYIRTDNDLVKYNPSGNVVWTKTMGGIGYDVATDSKGHIYTTASFTNSVTVGSYTFSFPASDDPMYVAKLDSDGNVLCAGALASGGDDQDGLATDNFGNAYIGGDYMVNPFIVGSDTLPFAPDESIFACRFTCGSCDTSSALTFYSNDAFLCEKYCTNFFDQSTNNPTSWKWSFPGGTPSSSTDQNPTNICYNNPGTYDVTLITTNSSGSDTLTLTNYITVYSTPPFPTITQNGNTLTCSPAYAYQWQLNSVNIPGATQQSYTITQSGLYTVLAFDSNGCSNYASADVTAVENIANDSGVSVFPNPSEGKFTVVFINAEQHSLEIENSLGHEIFPSEEIISGRMVSEEIDLTSFPSGVYLLAVKNEKTITIVKLVKE